MDLHEVQTGQVWKLGDHVNTDLLHPPSYFSLDEVRVKEGLFEGAGRIGVPMDGDSKTCRRVIVAGENFGCGSSRETSVWALKLGGIKAVLAKSFARIFYRSLANQGIPPLICNGIHDAAKNGDMIRISIEKGFAELADKMRFPIKPMDTHIKNILMYGGLIPYLKERLNGI